MIDEDWICEKHPLKTFGHDNCGGAGIPKSSMIEQLVHLRRNALQELKECRAYYENVVESMLKRIYELENKTMTTYTVTTYLKNTTGEGYSSVKRTVISGFTAANTFLKSEGLRLCKTDITRTGNDGIEITGGNWKVEMVEGDHTNLEFVEAMKPKRKWWQFWS